MVIMIKEQIANVAQLVDLPAGRQGNSLICITFMF